MLEYPAISHRGADPPYAQIAGRIEEAIRGGDLAAGDVLPSEGDIMQATGCGRTTVRRAMRRLRDQGLIVTVPTRGSYVARGIPPG